MSRSPRACRMSASAPLVASAARASTPKSRYLTGNRNASTSTGTPACTAGYTGVNSPSAPITAAPSTHHQNRRHRVSATSASMYQRERERADADVQRIEQRLAAGVQGAVSREAFRAWRCRRARRSAAAASAASAGEATRTRRRRWRRGWTGSPRAQRHELDGGEQHSGPDCGGDSKDPGTAPTSAVLSIPSRGRCRTSCAFFRALFQKRYGASADTSFHIDGAEEDSDGPRSPAAVAGQPARYRDFNHGAIGKEAAGFWYSPHIVLSDDPKQLAGNEASYENAK